MTNTNNLDEIKGVVQEFFQKAGIDAEIEFSPLQELPQVSDSEEKGYAVFSNLKTKDPQLLIGERGQTLLEIQQLLRLVLRKKTGKQFFFDIDINDYKKKKTEYLKELARFSAEEVILSKKEKILPPMPSYERRIVHSELSGSQSVTTESAGEEPERRVVIKPRSGL